MVPRAEEKAWGRIRAAFPIPWAHKHSLARDNKHISVGCLLSMAANSS